MLSPRMADRSVLAEVTAQGRPGRRQRSLNTLHLLVADVVAIACSTTVARLAYQAVSGERPTASLSTTAVMLISFIAALAVSGSYPRCTNGLIASRPFHGAVWHGLPLGVVLALLVP